MRGHQGGINLKERASRHHLGGTPGDYTGENVVFSLPIIDAQLGLRNIRSVICLGNFWTGRRYPMTLHRHWPAVEKTLVAVNHYATPQELWYTDPELSARVINEWNKIEPYKAKGFIAAWP